LGKNTVFTGVFEKEGGKLGEHHPDLRQGESADAPISCRTVAEFGGAFMKAFTSLTQAIDFYLDTRRQWGFALKPEERTLRQLAAYAQQIHHRGPLTSELVLAWAALPATASPLWWATRLSVAVRFARFIAPFDPRTQVPPSGVFGPAGRRRSVHLYTPQQIAQVRDAAATLEPVESLRPATFQTFWGLLACTGLRVGEALRLQDADFDPQASTLTIRRSKFGRSRCLPLHPSAVAALRAYQGQRQQHFPALTAPRFFLTLTGRPLSYSQAEKTFRRLRQQLGWQFSPAPRLYDLRHTFTVERLLGWYRQGPEPVDQHIYTLATYLGHRHIRHTYWYLSAVAELLALANARVAAAWNVPQGGAHVS
jgi:integrase